MKFENNYFPDVENTYFTDVEHMYFPDVEIRQMLGSELKLKYVIY